MSVKKSDQFRQIYTEKMQAYVNDWGYQELSHTDPVTLGKAFLKFYLYEILIAFFDLDDEEIEAGIVDGKNDLGIDFITIIENQVFIIQSKYGNSYKGEEDLTRLISLPTNLRVKEYIERAKPELKEIISEVKKIKNPTYNLYFITSQKIEEGLIQHYEQNASANSIVQIFDRSRLWMEYNRAQSLTDAPPQKITLNKGDEDFLELKHLKGEYPTIFLTQKGSKVKDLYNRYKETLFNYNIRLWLGTKNPVNSSMIETIQNEYQNFFLYNNGITAVCEGYEEEDNTLVFLNFQIINGAQTVTTIAKQNSSNLSDLKVFFKIIVGEHGKKVKDPDGLNEKIVKNTNSQSVINPSDFRSNDTIQLSIEKKANQLNYTLNSPFKQVFYKRKRRKEIPKKNSKAITMQDIGKSYYAFFYNPYDLNASIRQLWDNSEKGLYYKVFGNDGEKVDNTTEEKLYEFFGSYYIFEYIKKKLKDKDKVNNPAVLFKYHILWAIKFLIDLKYKKEYVNRFFRNIVDDGLFINDMVGKIEEEKFGVYVEKATKHINLLIKRERNNSEVFVIRNAQRSKKFADTLFMELETLLEAKDLPDLLK